MKEGLIFPCFISSQIKALCLSNKGVYSNLTCTVHAQHVQEPGPLLQFALAETKVKLLLCSQCYLM